MAARQAGDALEQATRAKARAERRRESAAQRGLVVRPVQRHHFSSALQRMSTVARVKGLKGPDGKAEDTVLRLVHSNPSPSSLALTLP